MEYSNNTPRRCVSLTLEDIYLLIHTGGTTGLPKAAMISHRAVLFNALNNILDWGLTKDDRVHVILPLFHTGGWNILTLAILRIGGLLMINKTFDPKLTLKVINDHKPTYVFGAATIFRIMYEQPDFDSIDWSSVKWVMSGAAPTPIQVMEKFWQKGIKICAGYGLTEGGPMNLGTPVDFMTIEELREKHSAVGKPFHFTVAKIVDDKGSEVGVEETGELIFAGPQIFSGYWGNEDETKKTLKDGWVYTGDMAKKDKDGFYYIVGRKKNMYISGGENVFPPEIEKVLYEIPEVHECCVIGVPDERWGESGKAVIAVKPDKNLTKEQVTAFLKSRLAHLRCRVM
jgi:fatty-acyl-CoA synthase